MSATTKRVLLTAIPCWIGGFISCALADSMPGWGIPMFVRCIIYVMLGPPFALWLLHVWRDVQ